MSKEKIEEMAKLICGLNTRDGCFCDGGYCNYNCLSYEKAEAIYNAGYRKQIEGEWKKRVWIVFDSEKVGYCCSECNTTWDAPTTYCPNCGAKMRKEDEGK